MAAFSSAKEKNCSFRNVIDSCRAVIGHKHRRNAAEEFEHVDMGPDPVPGPFVHKGFDIRVLAVSDNAYEQPAVGDFTSVWIDDVCGIACPVDFDLFTRLSGNVHRCTAFLLIPADIFAKLGIHESFICSHAEACLYKYKGVYYSPRAKKWL